MQINSWQHDQDERNVCFPSGGDEYRRENLIIFCGLNWSKFNLDTFLIFSEMHHDSIQFKVTTQKFWVQLITNGIKFLCSLGLKLSEKVSYSSLAALKGTTHLTM